MSNQNYLAVPRAKRGQPSAPTAQLLDDFAKAAERIAHVSNVRVRKSSVVFSATSDALQKLQAQFGDTFIIEPERYLDPLA